MASCIFCLWPLQFWTKWPHPDVPRSGVVDEAVHGQRLPARPRALHGRRQARVVHLPQHVQLAQPAQAERPQPSDQARARWGFMRQAGWWGQCVERRAPHSPPTCRFTPGMHPQDNTAVFDIFESRHDSRTFSGAVTQDHFELSPGQQQRFNSMRHATRWLHICHIWSGLSS